MVIYADVLILFNMLVDGLLLDLSLRMTHQSVRRKGRLILAAFLGGISSLLLLAPKLNLWLLLLIRLALSALMSLILLGRVPASTYLSFFAVIYILSLLLGGCCLAVDLFLSPEGMVVRNGQVYLNLSFLQLVFLVSGVYLVIRGLRFLRNRNDSRRQSGALIIRFRGKSCCLNAFCDSGNLLRDPVGGKPVAICRASSLVTLFPEEIREKIAQATGAIELLQLLQSASVPTRLIPYQGLGSHGSMPVFTPTEATWQAEDHKICGEWAVGILPSGVPLAEGVEAILRLPQC